MYNQCQARTLVACPSHGYWEPCDNTGGKMMYVCIQKQDQTPCPCDYTGEEKKYMYVTKAAPNSLSLW